MSTFNLIQDSCLNQTADAIVNAANRYLQAGGGICGAIFQKAGLAQLQQACDQFDTPLKDSDVVITPAFNMTNAKYIIHAVGPDFSVTPLAFKELYDTYYHIYQACKDNNFHTLSLCLISSGIYGGRLPDAPRESAKQAMRAYTNFIKDYPDFDIDIKLCAFTPKEFKSALKEYVIYL